MKEVLVTGSSGIIGSVIIQELKDQYNFSAFHLPDYDVLDEVQLKKACVGKYAVLHLAWQSANDNWRSKSFDPVNLQMAENVYRAASAANVNRVVMASSIHAHNPKRLDGKLNSVDEIPFPDSPYGAAKCMIESLGRYYATSYNLGTVCIRFGGVNRQNMPAPEGHPDRPVWLSQEDCSSLINIALVTEMIPHNFVIIQGVSDNQFATHDSKNELGWSPQNSTRE